MLDLFDDLMYYIYKYVYMEIHNTVDMLYKHGVVRRMKVY